MSTLNIRIDPQTAAFVDRIARERGVTKSEVVRQALAGLREQEKPASRLPLSVRLAHLIGSGDSGGMQLSERTGERFAQMLLEERNAKRTRRRRTARRGH
ncbi:MAG TPA: ribbon-helix-helix protein, CopG family [Candidatus Binatus sp.]|nr:ribbon-helix-helix protein, CopG family [Candidatus Binatus sp.]